MRKKLLHLVAKADFNAALHDSYGLSIDFCNDHIIPRFLRKWIFTEKSEFLQKRRHVPPPPTELRCMLLNFLSGRDKVNTLKLSSCTIYLLIALHLA